MTDRARTTFYALLALGALGVLALRIWIAHGLPFWLDETWTAVIAGQPDFAGLVREAWLDANAPLYYLFIWLWPGPLRLPSLLFMVAAALLPLLWRRDRLSVVWAALLFFWAPGMALSADARGYALLFLLGTAQAIAFISLLERPSLRRAAIWCGLCSLAILTQYLAAFVALAQGLVYLATRRREAVATLPALLLLAPALAWAIYHLPRILLFARADVAWQRILSPGAAAKLLAWPLGPRDAVFLAGVALILLAAFRWREQIPRPYALAAAAGTAALLLMLAVGMLRPLLVDRYLVPTVPSVLLGLALLAGNPIGRAALCAWFLLFAVAGAEATRSRLLWRSSYGFDLPSRFLVQGRPDELVFAFDYPGWRGIDPGTLAQIGSHFLRRSDLETRARMITLGKSPARELAAAARSERSAILWFYRGGRGAEVEALQRDWTCRRWQRGTLACMRPEMIPGASTERR